MTSGWQRTTHIRRYGRELVFITSHFVEEKLGGGYRRTTRDVTRSTGTPSLFHSHEHTTQLERFRFGSFQRTPTLSCLQIPACEHVETPTDCPEKKAGKFCNPIRPGMFRVSNQPIVLHVGSDVQNAMTCMVQADAVLMGCSTFGQVAGMLTKGISLFSTECNGSSTPPQYKLVPPLAVAERGHLWVPITGSWRDPVLASPELLSGALDDLLATRMQR